MITGADLANKLRAGATARGLPVADFVKPLATGTPLSWLNRLAEAKEPRRYTIARVEALVAGDQVPPVPTTARQSHRRGVVRRKLGETRLGDSPSANPPAPVHRDPCSWCGVRADIGHATPRCPGTRVPSPLE